MTGNKIPPSDSPGPIRVKLSRSKGWRKPDNTVVVARPGKWGNPFTVSDYIEAGYKPTSDRAARVACVAAFEDWLRGDRSTWAGEKSDKAADAILSNLSELRGKNLACWCPLDQPCHADVLLRLANK